MKAVDYRGVSLTRYRVHHLAEGGNSVMNAPEVLHGEPAGGTIATKPFVAFFRRASGVSKELIAPRTLTASIALPDV
jgi:hypothetical protein